MLNAAVRALRSGREPDLLAPLRVVTEINLHVPALLPTDYVNDVHQRLSMYKKLASADSEDELIERQEELVDRYGKLPEPAKALIETHRLRLTAEKLGVKKIDASADVIVIQFVPRPAVRHGQADSTDAACKDDAAGGPGATAHRGEDGQPRRATATAARSVQSDQLISDLRRMNFAPPSGKPSNRHAIS